MIYLIRHALTEANLAGSMVKNYDEYPIIDFDVEKWYEKAPQELKNIKKVYISDTLRTRQTAEKLFPNAEIKVFKWLNEFDCSGLGDKKFWQITEEEFNQLVDLSPELIYGQCFHAAIRMDYINDNYGDAIYIGHGMKMRALIRFFKLGFQYKNFKFGPKEFNAYRLINSLDEDFKNLDICSIDLNNEIIDIIKYN